MTIGYVISCQSGAMPVSGISGLNGNMPICARISGVADQVIFTPVEESCSAITGTPSCPVGFDVNQIDPSVFAGFFLAGFALFLTPYCAAWGMAQIVKSIRGR